jgi:hypothetical protein
LTATDSHPIWVAGRGWIDAADVRAGDRVLGPDGVQTTVTSVRDRGYVADQTVYNLNVGDTHTYLVLVDGHPILVHNKSCPGLYIIHLKDGRKYVGISTKNMDKRLSAHLNRSKGALRREKLTILNIDRVEQYCLPGRSFKQLESLERRIMARYGGPKSPRLLNRRW